MATRFRVISTGDGQVGFAATERGLARVFLPEPSAAVLRSAIRAACPDATEDPRLMPDFAAALERYFAGEPVQFEVKFDETGHGAFESEVWRACAAIEYGETCSYKDLATAVGRPGAARAVGTAMGRNPWPIIVPCHRVLKSDGGIGGYSGRQGIDFKRRLLEMEAAAVATLVS